MRRIVILYALGVIAAALAGFCSPWWWTGFIPLAAGAIWAAYDLVDLEENDGDSPRSTPKPR